MATKTTKSRKKTKKASAPDTSSLAGIEKLLGDRAESLLGFSSPALNTDRLALPGPNFLDDVVAGSDRSIRVIRSLSQLFGHGRLAGTGYMSILPVDQGIEHSASASFAPNPDYFDPVNIVELAMEGGCNAVTTTVGALGVAARRFAHKIPFILKLNHNEFLSYPNTYDQVMFGSVKKAHEMGCVAVGATIYFGSAESRRQIVEVAEAFEAAHDLGMATVLWCYLRNSDFSTEGVDYHVASDLTSQAIHLGATIQADIVKQKLPETSAPGFTDIGFGKTHDRVYTDLMSDHPIDMTRYQVAGAFMGRAPLINSGGASGDNDFQDAAATAVINKRAGGAGLISGRKAFQRPRADGIRLLNHIQDVYLCDDIGVA